MKKIIHNLSKITAKKVAIYIILVGALVNYSVIAFSQSPSLGTVADFVLFSSNGAVTNTGISQLTGNVGTNTGPISGFGNVNGVMQNIDGATAACAADLLTFYGQLNSAIPTLFPSELLGNGDTLVAGVYKIFSKATLNGNLYLDGKGNANAVFIFQIQGAFSTAALSKVKLINGTQACNVFWKVEGLVDMATKTYMRGTVVANNAAIVTNSLDTLEGRLVTTTGAITISGSMTYLPTGCNKPLLTGPIPPPLGATACFALFSSIGAVANTGITYIVGDVGTNVGLAIGFDSLIVKGKIHVKPDVSTATCAADLQTMYNYIYVLKPDVELLYPAQFGHNLVLTPHTYLLNAATAFTDTLYLNALGNTEGVFVIKVNGALTTSTFSKVILINGAQAKNVFWQIEGQVQIANNSVFQGTLICNNAAIGVSIGDSIIGRLLTTNGALSLESLMVTIPKNSCNSPLPINWTYFIGQAVEQSVCLKWSALNDFNNKFYIIERSGNGINFNKLTSIKADAMSTSPSEYSYTDTQPYSIGYYRISQIDNDGQQTFSKPIQVIANINKSIQVQSYIVANKISVKISGYPSRKGIIELYTIDGRIIKTKEVLLKNEGNTYLIEKPLYKGTYILSISGENKRLYTGKVVVL